MTYPQMAMNDNLRAILYSSNSNTRSHEGFLVITICIPIADECTLRVFGYNLFKHFAKKKSWIITKLKRA